MPIKNSSNRYGAINHKEKGRRLILFRGGSSGPTTSPAIRQIDLEELLIKRRRTREKEEQIAAAIQAGARVEEGPHTAEFIREVNPATGSFCLRLVVILFMLILFPGAGATRDSNGDGRIDFSEFLESFFPSAMAGQAAPQKFIFPGGTLLHVKIDEMSDRLACTIATPQRGIWLEFYGEAGATVWTDEGLALDYAVKPLMRIGAAEPFALDTTRHPHPMSVPREHLGELVAGLYSGKKVIVRFTVWPSGESRTLGLEVGDFAGAYDRAAKTCSWPQPRVPRAALSLEPEITKTDESTHATFGGQWFVSYTPEFRSCHLMGPATSGVSVYFHNGNALPPTIIGSIKVYKASGEFLRGIDPGPRAELSMLQLIAAAIDAGDGGFMDRGGNLHSLFGLVEAAAFAEKTCGVKMPY